MDDQFNGRTDDDLFADDFEPVEAQQEAPPIKRNEEIPPMVENGPPSAKSEESPLTAVHPAPAQHAPRSLDQSRHANAKPASSSPSSSHHNQRPRKHSPKPFPADTANTPPESPQDIRPKTSGSGGDNSAAKKAQVSPAKPGQNTALADRLASGANPRTKLTETELAAKMEQMRLLAAEKTRRFEQAERDSRSHAAAYEKGMEEARKRRAEDVERRRKGAEERRRMDEERAANRERKLKAMGAKEGGSWDEGKAFEEERDRRTGFRSANGGVRGARNTGGIAGSRFAERDSDTVPREFGFDDFRGRARGGRGRGGSRGGARGGKGGLNDESRPSITQNGNTPRQQKAAQAPPTVEDFPALPTPKKLDATIKATDTSMLSPSFNSPPIGKWDDEMAALDAKKAET